VAFLSIIDNTFMKDSRNNILASNIRAERNRKVNYLKKLMSAKVQYVLLSVDYKHRLDFLYIAKVLIIGINKLFKGMEN